ncbi:hypothetical protein HPB51_008804 [Rhipicephalus microplus]|uniref:CIZ1 C2H2-type zinc finger domain-containing protein n=1 Tax=Rhipicephalus microplus TaxID=6941 RepID=A0A9J6EZC4_RHIMP|nr:hypothetical protein HPB51_008804 [Rhipicephalus microplus]
MCAPHDNFLFMGGSMTPDMTQFGGNISFRSNYGHRYDLQDRYRPRQGYNVRYGNRPGGYGRRNRKRSGPSGERSRSPALKRGVPWHDGVRKHQDRPKKQGTSQEEAAAAEHEVGEASGAQAGDLYDPAEPTMEDTVDGAEGAEEQEDHDTGECAEGDANEADDQEGEVSAHQDQAGSGEGASALTDIPASTVPAKPVAKASGSKASDARSHTKEADARGQAGERMAEKGRQGFIKGSQKGQGWCTVCEIHFDDDYIDHSRTENHKITIM